MTAFVLVSGTYTGGWVWREVAARLQESGAEVHSVTLTGMGDRRHLAGPGTDLETHVQDVVQLIDHVEAPDVVIVGHCYGIHPVLGAADRRPERISRIVYLNAGMPEDGDPALKSVTDQVVRDLLLKPEGGRGEAGDDWLLPSPAPDEWQRWGGVADLSADALERLTSLAAPQPRATLTQPLRLSGAVAGLPTTGVLCTANGASIALVESLVGFGDPRLQSLVDPRVTFFELDAGHWPMLSCPDELAAVLLRAAAGEGHRLTAKEDRPPAQPFPVDVPERPRERVGRVDLYLPDADEPRPAVVFVHGGPVPAGVEPTPRDWPAFLGYGRYAASLGAVGVTVDHRLHDLADYPTAAEDVAAAIELVRADPRVDGDRIALWFFSGGGPLSADWLAEPPGWLRCVAATYPVLAPLPGWGVVGPRFRPAVAVRTAGRLPIVLTRVGLEQPALAATVEEFVAAAEECQAAVEVIDAPLAHHGFETMDPPEHVRDAVQHAMRSVLGHLRG
ncbi:alpha/beta fold hydrolase [Streptomyces sp. SCA3-4]|uniref:alpha/beta fold hydrolase n=1 Tax=Streptomyces sichuanensis TaxID=2871810 RepID=UPI001CE25C65|nr:alpha/beta fold hydrolase [Streptomyces sichuanensis]MCA6092037.1 alpha/beta fold hydrolase [Streptomyces sichuanensis]